MRLAESCMVDEFVFPFCIIVEAILVDVKFFREFSKKIKTLIRRLSYFAKEKKQLTCERNYEFMVFKPRQEYLKVFSSTHWYDCTLLFNLTAVMETP